MEDQKFTILDDKYALGEYLKKLFLSLREISNDNVYIENHTKLKEIISKDCWESVVVNVSIYLYVNLSNCEFDTMNWNDLILKIVKERRKSPLLYAIYNEIYQNY